MPVGKLKQYNGRSQRSTRYKKSVNKNFKHPHLKTLVVSKNLKRFSGDESMIMTVKNTTLDDSIWKDSFDHLLEGKSPLREKNILKKSVRLSYNLDSSVNTTNEKSTNENRKSDEIFSTRNNFFLNETPIYKRKSFIKRYNAVFNKNEKNTRTKSTAASTPLVHGKHSKRKTSKAVAVPNDLLSMATLSPIKINESPKLHEFLLTSYNTSEEQLMLQNILGTSSLNEPISPPKKVIKAKRSILNNSQSITQYNENNMECISSRNYSNLAKNISSFKVLNPWEHNNSLKLTKNQEITSLDVIHLNNSESICETTTIGHSNNINSILCNLSDAEKSFSIIQSAKKNKSKYYNQVDVTTINKSLMIIEHAYNSIFENAEILTPEINEKFNDIEKNIDNLIVNSTRDGTALISTDFTNEKHITSSKTIDSLQLTNPDLNNKTKSRNIFENNIFVNKLKFLQNCLNIHKATKRWSFPNVSNKKLETALIRSNSTNNILKTDSSKEENGTSLFSINNLNLFIESESSSINSLINNNDIIKPLRKSLLKTSNIMENAPKTPDMVKASKEPTVTKEKNKTLNSSNKKISKNNRKHSIIKASRYSITKSLRSKKIINKIDKIKNKKKFLSKSIKSYGSIELSLTNKIIPLRKSLISNISNNTDNSNICSANNNNLCSEVNTCSNVSKNVAIEIEGNNLTNESAILSSLIKNDQIEQTKNDKENNSPEIRPTIIENKQIIPPLVTKPKRNPKSVSKIDSNRIKNKSFNRPNSKDEIEINKIKSSPKNKIKTNLNNNSIILIDSNNEPNDNIPNTITKLTRSKKIKSLTSFDTVDLIQNKKRRLVKSIQLNDLKPTTSDKSISVDGLKDAEKENPVRKSIKKSNIVNGMKRKSSKSNIKTILEKSNGPQEIIKIAEKTLNTSEPIEKSLISKETDIVRKLSNVTTRRRTKQKSLNLTPETITISLDKNIIRTKSFKININQNDLLKSSNEKDFEFNKTPISRNINKRQKSLIRNKENVNTVTILENENSKKKSISLNEIKHKENSIHTNESIINLTPEVQTYRKLRSTLSLLKQSLTKTKLKSIDRNERKSMQKSFNSKTVTKQQPRRSPRLKNCRISIKKNNNNNNNNNTNNKKILQNRIENDAKVTTEKEIDDKMKISLENSQIELKKSTKITTIAKKYNIRNCKIRINKKNEYKNSKNLQLNRNKNDQSKEIPFNYNLIVPEIHINDSTINELKMTEQIENENNHITIDNSINDMSFDRDEFLKNIENNQVKIFTKKSLKSSSLSRRGTLIDLTNNLNNKIDLINRKSIRNSNNKLSTSSTTLRKSSLKKQQKEQKNSSTRATVLYETLHENSELPQKSSLSTSTCLNHSHVPIILPAGKWRRSLIAWRKDSLSFAGKINSSQLLNTEFVTAKNRSEINRNKVENSNKENTDSIRCSDVVDRNSKETTSLSYLENNSIKLRSSKRKAFSLNSNNLTVIPQNVNEINLNLTQPQQKSIRKTLLLEPTDDEAPIIQKSCSLFNTFEKNSKLSSSIGAAETAGSCIQEKLLLQYPIPQQQKQQQQHQQKFFQNNFIEKSLQQRQSQKPPSTISHQYPEIVEEAEEEDEEEHHQQQQVDEDSEYNQSDGDVEYFDDRRTLIKNNQKNNNNSKQQSDEIQKSFYVQKRRATASHQQQKTIYQHQLSLPVKCGNKQSVSVLGQPSNRRRRTSFIEGFVDLCYYQEQRFLVDTFIRPAEGAANNNTKNRSGTEEENQLQKFIFNKSTSLSSGIFENDEQLICCPTLDVSLRAQLSPRDIVLRRCQQTDPFEFSAIYSESLLRQCRKIGEGVYGEVFMNKNQNGDAIVLKIIPIEGNFEVNGEVQKNFEQILPEIIIAEELSRLRYDKKSVTSGFVEVKNVHCVQGSYPEHLIDLWELYRDNCGTENDHPEIFPEDQLYIVFELANAGQDLEAYNFENALQSHSAFLQVSLSLAVAEEKFKFEHRDLHWGNILLSATEQKEIIFKLNGKEYKLPTHGIKATIIDYTLSRMIFEGCCLYNDLSNDNELFSASGDYQFDVYRSMQKRLDNQWERYDPYTNILWLHYAVDKMISGARYRSSKTKKHRSAIQKLMTLRDELLDYNSASNYVEVSFDD